MSIDTNLGEVTFITTGKLDANAQDHNGKYPFFTCGEENLTINTAAFDTEAVLLAGNGNFSIKYYKGKFNAYQRTYVITPNLVDGKWLFYLVMHHIAKITAGARGSTIKYLRIGDITDCSVKLVPLSLQKRIVAKIEELFSELDNGIATLKTAREQLKVYRQAVLKHAFEGKLTTKWRDENADKLETPEQLLTHIQQDRDARYQQQLEEWKVAVKKWEVKGKEGKKPSKPKEPNPTILSDSNFNIPNYWATTNLGLIADVSGGLTKNQKRNGFPVKMKYLRVANVYADGLLLDDIQEIGVAELEAKKVLLIKNDLLVVEGNGSVEQIGRVALWDASISGCGHQNHLIKVRLDNPDYARLILLFLLSPVGRSLIVKEASSTSGLHTLSISKVSNLQIPIMTMIEATLLMSIVDEKITLAAKLEEEIKTEIKRSETLRQSILKKAFSGQLVPQDPNDEPARELLERIRDEKEQQKQLANKLATKGRKKNVCKEV